MPALTTKTVGAFARKMCQIVRGEAVRIERWRDGNSLDAVGCGEWEGRWGVGDDELGVVVFSFGSRRRRWQLVHG